MHDPCSLILPYPHLLKPLFVYMLALRVLGFAQVVMYICFTSAYGNVLSVITTPDIILVGWDITKLVKASVGNP